MGIRTVSIMIPAAAVSITVNIGSAELMILLIRASASSVSRALIFCHAESKEPEPYDIRSVRE